MDDKQQNNQNDEDKNEDESTQDVQEEKVVEKKIIEENIDYKDKWLRANADYQNLQKEIATQKSQWAKWSKVQILEEFIPVYENFKKAFSAPVPEEGDHKQCDNWKKGIEYIMKQFENILKEQGVEPIETIGKEFDPNLHEALSEEYSEEYDDGIIIREVGGGYMVGDKVLQVAKVVLCKKE